MNTGGKFGFRQVVMEVTPRKETVSQHAKMWTLDGKESPLLRKDG